jgi:hypothetical protein
MEDTIRRLAKVLGATGLEGNGADARFAVEAPDGSRLKVQVGAGLQRLMCVLQDPGGVTRADLDIAPVKKVEEDPNFAGRVVVHVGVFKVQLDTQPTLAVEVFSGD